MRIIDQIPRAMSSKRTRSVGNDRVLALKRSRISPLSGTVNDTTATIRVSVGGQTNLAATNNGNGTWTLADNAQAWEMNGSGDYRIKTSRRARICAQELLLADMCVGAINVA